MPVSTVQEELSDRDCVQRRGIGPKVITWELRGSSPIALIYSDPKIQYKEMACGIFNWLEALIDEFDRFEDLDPSGVDWDLDVIWDDDTHTGYLCGHDEVVDWDEDSDEFLDGDLEDHVDWDEEVVWDEEVDWDNERQDRNREFGLSLEPMEFDYDL